MKLIRFGPAGAERPGIQMDDGTCVDAGSFGRDYDEAFFSDHGIEQLRDWAARHADVAPRVPPDPRRGPPFRRPSKIVCIGLNFRDHAAESGMAAPEEPVIFLKSTTALTGPDDPLVMPRQASKSTGRSSSRSSSAPKRATCRRNTPEASG